MKLNKIDEVWNSANSLFEWRFRFVVIQKFILPWQRDVTTSLLYVPCFWIKSYYNFEQHTSCITYVCNTCLVLSLNSVLPSVLPPRRHGLLSETRNEGFCCLPFLLTQVLVRNCSTRYEFLTNGSRWEGRGKGWEGRGERGEASCAPAIQTSVKFRDFADLQLLILRFSFQPCSQIWGRFSLTGSSQKKESISSIIPRFKERIVNLKIQKQSCRFPLLYLTGLES